MNTQRTIQSQYLAALKMLKEAVVKCPPADWNDPRDDDKTWYKVYHTLYWTHKYLGATRKDSIPWKGHGKPNDWKGHRKLNGGLPISKKEILEYLNFVEQQVVERVRVLDFEGGSGFPGSPMDRLEMQLVNIRHIQQHTGELYERLGTRENIQLRWAEQVHRKQT
jgi:hypothetical protein